ncbi:MAG: phenylalanine--tRNA ligase subunit beta [Gammaproteobacteria bacterium]|nr:phenylalanine--tRNA ligase subunit beta [Gammaproteobacteria bacterium]
MRFSEKWLRQWTSPDVDTGGLVAQLTAAGLEVDAVEDAAPYPLNGVVVGRVTAVEPHPDADKLRVCRVDVGQGDLLTIVCGAPNVHEGMRAPTALVGAVMPGGMEIKRARLRGVESAGMLCSAKELGLSDVSAGLMDLPADAPAGVALYDYLELGDACIEVDLTPNRGDCLGLAGIAREVGVLNRSAVTPPDPSAVAAGIDDTFPVRVDAPEACPRYVGRVVRDVDAGAATPLWMQERLRRSGLRSISALVDITNYVLLEFGQPMHAFDLERLRDGIEVRMARPGEGLELLDGETVELQADTLVIADGAGPVAMAGIMGGLPSAVGEGTRHIFLESAFFAPLAIAGKARAYGRHTDSSHRFERGVDPELQRRAVERATRLVLDIAGGMAGPVVEVVSGAHLPVRAPIPLRGERIKRLLGTTVPAGEVIDILERLGCAVTGDDGRWQVTAPSYRFDLTIEADLIEELARVVGYDRIPSTTPEAGLEVSRDEEEQVPLDTIQRTLIARGYQEAITFSFVDPRLQALLDPEHPPIALANPISSEMAVMRTSLWPGLVGALRYNANRQQARVRLFETGLRFRQGTTTEQVPMLAGIAAGTPWPEQWGVSARALDFFDIKGDVEALLGLGGCGDEWSFVAHPHAALHPGQSARIERNGEAVGWLGALHPAHGEALDIAGPVFVFEVLLDRLMAGRLPRYDALSRFPLIRRDLAVVVDEAVTAQNVRECIGQAASDMLKNLQLFDVYRGEHIDSGKKSLALGLMLQAPDKTLTDEEVDSILGRVVLALERELGGRLRG